MLRNFIFFVLVLIGTPSLHAQQRVDFEGNKVFSTADLLAKFNSCVAKSPDPDGKNAERIRDYCLQMDVRKFMWSRGYLNAKISTPKDQNGGGNLNFVVWLDEGVRYRLGNVKITGSEAFTPERLREKLKLKTGDIADGKEIQDWVFERINNLYADDGRIQSSAEFDPVFRPDPDNPNEGIADLDVTIEEGRQFTLRKIEFNGNGYVRDRILRDAMTTKEGDIFSQKLLDESIKKLNQLGLFKFIDKDSDVKIMVDEESYDVEITVRVTERPQR